MIQNIHFSFDLWNTLFVPNKKYKENTIKYLSDLSLKSVDETFQIYTAVKKEQDILAEDHGLGFPTELIWRKVLFSLGVEFDESILDAVYDIFLKNRPTIPPDTLKKLIMLQKRQDTNIASNTVVIPGKILKVVLDELGLDNFNFQLYSDEIGFSKPNPEFFKKIADLTNKDKYIVHIGDSEKTDGAGARAAGFRFIKTSDPFETASILDMFK